MAVLSDPNREALFGRVAQDFSTSRTSTALVKADFRAAINAIDDWVEANASSFNTAIPQPARGALTTQQKAKLLMFVIERRFEVA